MKFQSIKLISSNMADKALHTKVAQQYDQVPYPGYPIETSIQSNSDFVALHQIQTPYALIGQPQIQTEGKLILDAGCGTGWAALALAEANPGATVMGVDLSAQSVEIARQRLNYHGFEKAVFQVLAIEDLPSLGLTFDYINCDQVLFFLPEPLEGLKAMRQVLKPGGIIRTNLHSRFQRAATFRAQEAFRLLGLLNDDSGEFEAAIAVEIMDDLQDEIDLKAQTWQTMQTESEATKLCFVLRDFLVQGDKGHSIPEMFDLLDAAGLNWISMVNSLDWLLLNLFKDLENPPASIAYAITEFGDREQLQLYELMNPVHRLLDFWCAAA